MNKTKPRLLMIFHRPPYPLIGGDKIRMHQNMKILSKRFELSVLFINDKRTDAYIKESILKIVDHIYVFDFMKYKFYLGTLFGFLLNKKPLQVNYYHFKKVQKWIDKNINSYDLVFCHTIRTAEYVKNKPIFKIIDFVDAISMNYEKAILRTNFGLWKMIYKIDKGRVLKYELKTLKLFDEKIIISEIDKKYILSKCNSPFQINIVQNAVDIKPIRKEIEEDYIVFVGKMDYEPNVSAVKYFSEDIFPKILEKFPHLEFLIVGANPSEKVKKLEVKPNVKVLGFVENLENIILKSKLVVAPMISGAGIQNKILISMSLKKCVITTKIGAEGLNNLSMENQPLIIASTKTIFVQKTLELLNNNDKRYKIGLNAYNYVKMHFSFNKVENDLLSIFKID